MSSEKRDHDDADDDDAVAVVDGFYYNLMIRRLRLAHLAPPVTIALSSRRGVLLLSYFCQTSLRVPWEVLVVTLHIALAVCLPIYWRVSTS